MNRKNDTAEDRTVPLSKIFDKTKNHMACPP